MPVPANPPACQSAFGVRGQYRAVGLGGMTPSPKARLFRVIQYSVVIFPCL